MRDWSRKRTPVKKFSFIIRVTQDEKEKLELAAQKFPFKYGGKPSIPKYVQYLIRRTHEKENL